MEFGLDDLLMLGIRWLPSFFCSFIASAAILGLAAVGKRLRPRFAYWRALATYLAPVPLIFWVIHSASTTKLDYVLTLLNSESSQVAERAYESRFGAEVSTLDEAVRLAVSGCEAPNVRFYASCLVADILVTNKSQSATAQALSKVDRAPTIKTQFFGGNRLTDRFYTPGHVQPQLSVRNIVEQRLQDLRKATQP
ncbi:MAG TPA: hypothetical protein VN578_08390 [Candidatus Binatia bacterium]|jgi:hypothetical protein|nr:hypothetical protein [Candidatus Binatia bacterium]